jgi:DNA-binding MarR family transcriptional regulator
VPSSKLQHEIKKRTPFERPGEEVYLNLLRTHSVLVAQFEKFFKEYGLTEPQYNVLRILRGARSGGQNGLPCLEIGQRMITRVPDVTRLVDRLQAAGLVTRGSTRHDRRVVLISITRSGLNLLTKIDDPGRKLLDQLMGHLQPKEVRELNRLLVKARQSVNGA